MSHARYISKRLRPHFPDLHIIVGLWQENTHSKKAEERLRASGIDHFVFELATAVDYILEAAGKIQRKEFVEAAEEESSS
jgi:hypothetical protein